MLLNKKIALFYEYFYQKISFRENFSFKPTKRERKSIQNFISLLEDTYGQDSIGSYFLYDFFCFQFNYWQDKDTRLGSQGLARIEWLIGPKSFERWKNKTKHYKYFYKVNLLNKVNLSFNEIEILINKEKLNFSSKYEEDLKEKYFNTKKGFLTCILYTSLFNEESIFCNKCLFSKKCEKIKL